MRWFPASGVDWAPATSVVMGRCSPSRPAQPNSGAQQRTPGLSRRLRAGRAHRLAHGVGEPRGGDVGAEGAPNLMFAAVLLLAIVGALVARLRPAGMARAMAMTGNAQLSRSRSRRRSATTAATSWCSAAACAAVVRLGAAVPASRPPTAAEGGGFTGAPGDGDNARIPMPGRAMFVLRLLFYRPAVDRVQHHVARVATAAGRGRLLLPWLRSGVRRIRCSPARLRAGSPATAGCGIGSPTPGCRWTACRRCSATAITGAGQPPELGRHPGPAEGLQPPHPAAALLPQAATGLVHVVRAGVVALDFRSWAATPRSRSRGIRNPPAATSRATRRACAKFREIRWRS